MKDELGGFRIQSAVIDSPATARITEPPPYDPFLAYLEFQLKQKEDTAKFWSKAVKIIGIVSLIPFIILGAMLL